MGRYLQKLSFGIDHAEWWVGWEIENTNRPVPGLVLAESLSPDKIRELGVTHFQRVDPKFLARLERRAVHRVRLRQPLEGRIGHTTIHLVDLSAGGAGIAHEEPLRPGKRVRVDLIYEGRLHAFTFDVLRCRLARGAFAHGDARYYSSLSLVSGMNSDKCDFERLVAAMVEANAGAIRENPGETLAFF